MKEVGREEVSVCKIKKNISIHNKKKNEVGVMMNDWLSIICYRCVEQRKKIIRVKLVYGWEIPNVICKYALWVEVE